jgi:hypothetical protein
MGERAVARAWGMSLVVLAAAPGAARAQVIVPSPSPIAGGPQYLPPVPLEDLYGPLEVADVDELERNGQSYHRRLVKTRGVVVDLVPGQYLQVQQGTSRLMLIPMNVADYSDYIRMMGMDVDVTGVVRVLPAKQQIVPCRGTRVLESKCEDWELPVLPDRQMQWPGVSMTILRMSDRGTNGVPRRTGTRTLADTGVDAAAADGKPVRALGQFRGANLCRDLPPESRREDADWVLLTTEGPVWVTGRAPAGKGFRLDPAYRGDTSRWLEVNGKVQIAGQVRYLKASRISLIARPEATEPVPCPP